MSDKQCCTNSRERDITSDQGVVFPVEICIEREKMYMVRANMQRQLKEDLNGICVDSIKGILRDWLTYDKVIPT